MTPAGIPLKWIRDHLEHSNDECLIWPFARNKEGYSGSIRWQGKSTRAYCVMLILIRGDRPTSDHEAAHSCGNGHLGCIHPKHLRWATHAENEADKVIHGTVTRGERNGQARLTHDEVLAIRATNGTQKDIGARFGIDPSMVSFIKNRKKWAWL